MQLNQSVTSNFIPVEAIEISTPEIVNTKYGAFMVEEVHHGACSFFTAKLGKFSRAGRDKATAVAALEKDLGLEKLISQGIH